MHSPGTRQSRLLCPAAIITLLLSGSTALAGPVLIDDFKESIRPGWQVKEFKGFTTYTPAVEDNLPCLKASAEGTASGLFYEIKYDPQRQPILAWKWKIDNIVKDGNALTKAGDDYAARIYVIFPAFFFWNTKALNYVWANQLAKGTAVPNSFTSNAMMIAVESGSANTGKWQEYRRNIYEDYQKYFKTAPPGVGAIAIMTDTDNTGNKASACYGPIYTDSE